MLELFSSRAFAAVHMCGSEHGSLPTTLLSCSLSVQYRRMVRGCSNFTFVGVRDTMWFPRIVSNDIFSATKIKTKRDVKCTKQKCLCWHPTHFSLQPLIHTTLNHASHASFRSFPRICSSHSMCIPPSQLHTQPKCYLGSVCGHEPHLVDQLLHRHVHAQLLVGIASRAQRQWRPGARQHVGLRKPPLDGQPTICECIACNNRVPHVLERDGACTQLRQRCIGATGPRSHAGRWCWCCRSAYTLAGGSGVVGSCCWHPCKRGPTAAGRLRMRGMSAVSAPAAVAQRDPKQLSHGSLRFAAAVGQSVLSWAAPLPRASGCLPCRPAGCPLCRAAPAAGAAAAGAAGPARGEAPTV